MDMKLRHCIIFSVGYDLDPISILQSINSPTRGELHARNSKNFQARIVTYKHGRIDRSGISCGGGCSIIVTSSSFESDRLGSAAIE